MEGGPPLLRRPAGPGTPQQWGSSAILGVWPAPAPTAWWWPLHRCSERPWKPPTSVGPKEEAGPTGEREQGLGPDPPRSSFKWASLSIARPPSLSSPPREAAECQANPAKSGHSHDHIDSARTSGPEPPRLAAQPGRPGSPLTFSLAAGLCPPRSAPVNLLT